MTLCHLMNDNPGKRIRGLLNAYKPSTIWTHLFRADVGVPLLLFSPLSTTSIQIAHPYTNHDVCVKVFAATIEINP